MHGAAKNVRFKNKKTVLKLEIVLKSVKNKKNRHRSPRPRPPSLRLSLSPDVTAQHHGGPPAAAASRRGTVRLSPAGARGRGPRYLSTASLSFKKGNAKDGSARFESLTIRFTISFSFLRNTRRLFWTEFVGFSFISRYVKEHT